jgi:hypothetical protein
VLDGAVLALADQRRAGQDDGQQVMWLMICTTEPNQALSRRG